MLLGALSALLVVLLVYQLFQFATGDLSLPLVGSSSADQEAARDFDLEVAELRLADLERRSRQLVLGRDPFRYATRPAPKPSPPAKPRAKRVKPKARPIHPQPPSIDLSYLGSFGPEDRKIAVFSDGKTIYNIMAGEVLESKFIVDRIGYESVDIKFVDFPDAPPKRMAAGG